MQACCTPCRNYTLGLRTWNYDCLNLENLSVAYVQNMNLYIFNLPIFNFQYLESRHKLSFNTNFYTAYKYEPEGDIIKA